MRKILFSLLFLLLALCATACSAEPLGEYALDGGAVCRVWGSTSGIRRLEVTDTAGETVKFSLPAPKIEPNASGGVELIDLNFDGHKDIRIQTKRYADGDMLYRCYLWQDGTLVESNALNRLRALTPDDATQTLTAWELRTLPDEYESRARLTYAWVNGEPMTVAKTELIHYTADEIYYLAVYGAEPGKPLELREEKWIFPEQFHEEEIWNETTN